MEIVIECKGVTLLRKEKKTCEKLSDEIFFVSFFVQINVDNIGSFENSFFVEFILF